MYLWSRSVPGIAFGTFILSVLTTVFFGFVWLVWFVTWNRKGNKDPILGWAIAPIMVVAVIALSISNVPLQARFEFDRSEFDAIVEDLDPAGAFEEWSRFDVPGNVGTYQITVGYQVGSNVILYERNGALFDDAGFAYLPDGPDPRLGNGSFESPSFRSLGGDWYAWTASW